MGGTRTISVDVRIIAATHRSMEEMIREGIFREDLWYRLNVFPIMIPPLRQRKEDIPALVHHFLERKSKELKLYPSLAISVEEMDRLKDYCWPGNVRELENLIERELIYTRGRGRAGSLNFRHLDILDKTEREAMMSPSRRGFPTLDESMAEHIRRAMRLTGGRIYGSGGAADLLGINPNTLRSRMRKLGILSGRAVNRHWA